MNLWQINGDGRQFLDKDNSCCAITSGAKTRSDPFNHLFLLIVSFTFCVIKFTAVKNLAFSVLTLFCNLNVKGFPQFSHRPRSGLRKWILLLHFCCSLTIVVKSISLSYYLTRKIVVFFEFRSVFMSFKNLFQNPENFRIF